MLRSETAANPARMQARAGRACGAIRRPSAPPPPAPMPAIAEAHGATLRDYGGDGPPVLFVPSLINPPNVLDLGATARCCAGSRRAGRRVLLLDWGWPGADARGAVGRRPCRARSLLPLIAALGEPADLVGYCLGGTMALAAARPAPARSVATIAAPWHFAGFPDEARGRRSRGSGPSAQPTVAGARPAADGGAAERLLEPRSGPHRRQVRGLRRHWRRQREARTFVTLEDWANDGPPLAGAAAREMFEDLFARRPAPARGAWRVGGAIVDPARARPARCSTSSRPPTGSSPPPPRPAPASGSSSRRAMSAWSSARGRARRCGSRSPAGFPALQRSC